MVNIFGDRGGKEGGYRGERGPIGPSGLTGNTGKDGARGDAGKDGVRGLQGVRGDSGPQGDKGVHGVAGPKDDRGSPGPKGSPGSTITDLCTWMPNTVLKNLQENEEEGCFFIIDVKKDIKREGSDIKQWISRNRRTHLNLVAEKVSKSLTDLSNGRHALVFKNSRYISEDILLLANHPESHGFICITFYTSGDHDQTILSNFEAKRNGNWHEISVTNTEITIWGTEHGKTKRVTIPHTVHKWTTLFIEQVTTKVQMQGRYIINNDPKLTGSFTFDCYHEMFGGFSVGSRYDDTRFLQGAIASIEMYHGKGRKQIPQAVKDLVIKNQLIEEENIKITINNINDEPPVKRKKISQSESC